MNPKPEPEDRLSGLPDDLIHHIFSSLDSIYIFQASDLCPRWRRLYATAPVLSFRDATYANRFPGAGLENRFGMLLRACFDLRDRRFPVQKLLIDADEGRVDPRIVEEVVGEAALQGLQRLELTGNLLNLTLPNSLYNCSSLKELTLRSENIKLSNDLGFPALTKLHLELVKFSHAKLSSDLISRCPNLETLTLRNCNIDEQTKSFRITSPKLTKLVISYPFDLWYLPKDCEFWIAAPKLACFEFEGIEAANCNLAFPDSLDEVEIDVFQGKHELFDGGLDLAHEIDKANGLIRMINAFKSAKTVKISEPTKKCLRKASDLGLVRLEDYKILLES